MALLAVVTASCDGSSSANPTTSNPPSTSTSTTPTVPVGPDGAELGVTHWGITSDGLLSVVVRNSGTASVRSARAIIDAEDADGNTVASVSAVSGTSKGTRCCTVIGLSPGHSYGLYSNIGEARISRVKKVEVEYVDVHTTPGSVPLPVVAASDASLTVNSGNASATVTVSLLMSKSVGPYITAQALLNGPSGKFLGVISGGFYCLKPGTKRTINLQFFHPVPQGSSVDRVVTYPLDRTTAQIENLHSCGG